MKLGTEVVLDPGHIVLDGDPAPSSQTGTAPPQFLAHSCCGQTAGWINMPLGRGRPRPRPDCVGLVPSSPLKGHSPQFSAHVYCGQTVAHLSYC